MQGRQGADRADCRKRWRIQQMGGGKVFTAVHHAVTDAAERDGCAFDQRQQLCQRASMVGAGNRQTLLVLASLPAQQRVSTAQAFGQAAEQRLLAGLAKQGKFDR